jgi:uncharacterized membrane protein (DUF2068 family)
MPHANQSVGLRTVAVLEAAKGILVLLLGFGVLALMHKNLDDVAERLTEILRVNPEGRLSNVFIHAANRATDNTLWLLAIGALVYAAVRFVEAFGLWRGRGERKAHACAKASIRTKALSRQSFPVQCLSHRVLARVG